MTTCTKRIHRWTDAEREIVQRDYRHTHKSRQEIAARLGVTAEAVAGQISQMGISRSDRHPWTEADKERLAEMADRYCVRRIGKMMGRSINSITLQMRRQKISRRVRFGWYTKKDACEILGVDHRWLQARIDSGALRARVHDPASPPQQRGSGSWHIAEDDLAAYIRRYPEELQGRNVDMVSLVYILSGVA